MKKLATMLSIILTLSLLCPACYAIDENSGIEEILEYLDNCMGEHSNISYSEFHSINAELADYVTAYPGTLLWYTDGYKENYLYFSETEWTLNTWHPEEYASSVAFMMVLYQSMCPQSKILVLYDGDIHIKQPYLEDSEFEDVLWNIYDVAHKKLFGQMY